MAIDPTIMANVVVEMTEVKARHEAVEKGGKLSNSSVSQDRAKGKALAHLTKRVEYRFQLVRVIRIGTPSRGCNTWGGKHPRSI